MILNRSIPAHGSRLTAHGSRLTAHGSRLTASALLMGMFLWFSTLHAQRIVPPLADWTSFPSGPFSQGSINGMIVQGSGSLADGATNDSGFFLHRPAGEGDDFRACFAAVSSSGLTGVMVRDAATPDAAFVFVGANGANETIVRYRHTPGAPAQTIAFGAVGASPWYRLVVGRDTVNAYTAGSASAATPTAWNFLTAIKVQLKGDKPSIRRNDLAGAFVSQGSATLADLYQTEHLIWTERTAESDAALPNGVWESIAPSVSQHAVSPMVRRHIGTGTAAHLDFPIQVKAEGTYHFFLHLPAGNPQTVSAMLVGQPTPVTRDNQPEGRNSWIYVGTSTLAANGTATVRLLHPGTAGLAMFGDAARAFRAAKAESPVSGYPGWTKTPALTDRITLPGSGPTNEVRRTQYAQNGSWNAGAYSSNVLVGDGKLRFRFVGDGLRMQAGLTTYPVSSDPAHIPYRFNNKGNGKIQAVGATSEFNYVNGDWMEIERIGRQIVFRRNSLFQHAVSLPEEAPAFYYVDASLLDQDARLYGTHVFGQWSTVAGVAGLIPNATVRAVIDADSEDGLQSIFDVDLGADLDEDGLTNEEEVAKGTLPENPDTDGDTLLDGDEVDEYDTDPTLWDTDGDGLSDGYEVTSAYGFDPTKRFTINDGVSDYTRWEILEYDPNDAFSELGDVLPDEDFDGDHVSNRHESADGTSARDVNDWFRPVLFDQLFGHFEGAAWTIDENDGIESSRLVRNSTTGNLAGGISNHEIIDGSSLRFQFVPLSTAAGTADQVVVGFSHRGHPPYSSLPDAHYAAAIRLDPTGKARILTYGTELTAVAPIEVNESDIIELRLETGDDGAPPRLLHFDVIDSITLVREPIASITLPAGAGGFDGFTWDHDKNTATDPVPAPLAVVVRLPAAGAGVKNLRYRGIHDPDSDNDQMADAWEQQIVDHVEGFTEVGQVLAGGDADDDDLLNLEEYELGTNPTEPDTDGDGMPDGWEVDHGLDPKNPADGSEALGEDGKPVADQDGDGLSNIEEYLYGSRPDRVSTMNDGFSDHWKHRWGLDPLVFLDPEGDLDSDGLSNNGEVQNDTNPDSGDTDNDGVGDGDEVAQGTDPGEPPIPMPSVVLQGRTHRTEGGGGMVAGFYGGNPDEVIIETRYRSYLLHLVRDLYDFNNNKTGEEPLEFIASAEEFQAELEQKFNEGWRKANEADQPQGLQPYEHIQIIPGSPPTWQDAWAEPLLAKGRMLPAFEFGEVGIVAPDGELRPFYEIPHPEAYWSGAVTQEKMGFLGAWIPIHRLSYGRSPLIGAPILENHTKFHTGLVPEVQWSEYWLQANGPVPRRKEAKFSLPLLAIERNADGEVTLLESGTVTFTIPGTKQLSTGKPEVTGFAAAASWVEARNDGTLMVVPPVERGVERRLLAVEIEQPQLNSNGEPTNNWESPDGIRISRFRDAFTDPSIFRSGFIDQDRDRFRIRMPLFEHTEDTITVKISTKAHDGTVADNSTEVTLSKKDGGYESQPMILVIDREDDHFDPLNEFSFGDDRNEDKTHQASLGGQIELEFVTVANGAKISKDIMKKNGSVDLQIFAVIPHAAIWQNGWMQAIRADIDVAKEIYASIGVDFNWGISALPTTAKIDELFADGKLDYEMDNIRIRAIDDDFINPYGSGDVANTITVFYVPVTLRKASRSAFFDPAKSYEDNHIFQIDKGVSWSSSAYDGYAFVSLVDRHPNTLAHEIGHLLGVEGNPHPYLQTQKHFLMREAADYIGSFKEDSKRFSKDDENRILDPASRYYLPLNSQ